VGWRCCPWRSLLYPGHVRTHHERCSRLTKRQPAGTGRRSPRAFGLSGADRRFARLPRQRWVQAPILRKGGVHPANAQREPARGLAPPTTEVTDLSRHHRTHHERRPAVTTAPFRPNGQALAPRLRLVRVGSALRSNKTVGRASARRPPPPHTAVDSPAPAIKRRASG
jgi:hypothetical protein